MEQVRAEFAEMPGLSVTVSQAERLWALIEHVRRGLQLLDLQWSAEKDDEGPGLFEREQGPIADAWFSKGANCDAGRHAARRGDQQARLGTGWKGSCGCPDPQQTTERDYELIAAIAPLSFGQKSDSGRRRPR